MKASILACVNGEKGGGGAKRLKDSRKNARRRSKGGGVEFEDPVRWPRKW